MSKAGWILGLIALGGSSVASGDAPLLDRIQQPMCCDSGPNNFDSALASIGCGNNDCDSASCDSCCPKRVCCHYWSVFGGWNGLEEYNGEDEGPPPTIVRNGSYQDGFLVGLARGRCLTRNLRGEIEFAYRRNETDQWSAGPVGAAVVPVNWDGNIDVFTGMSNLIMDFGNSKCRKVTPYGGAGLGFAVVDGDFTTAAGSTSIDQTAFAFQGFGGLSFRAKENVRLFTEYRFLGTTDLELTDVLNGNMLGNDPYQSHSVLVGIQLRR